jgi:hypothetical protein
LKRDRKDLGRTGDTQQLKKPPLSIEDTLTQQMRTGKAPPRPKPAKGGDPYETLPTTRGPDAGKRNTDLRRLSEWIRAKRQAEALKKDDKDGRG